MSGDNGRATDKQDATKSAVTETVEATGRVIADGIIKVIEENREHPYIYIPIVRRMLDALERVGAMPALGAGDIGLLGEGNGNYGHVGVAGLMPARGLRDDPVMAGVRGILEALQPVIDQAANAQRIPALRAVLESPLCSDEVKQQAADELSRVVMAATEVQDAEAELLGPGIEGESGTLDPDADGVEAAAEDRRAQDRGDERAAGDPRPARLG
jgi:hypothetical protein